MGSLASHEATLIVLTHYDLKGVLLAQIKQEYSEFSVTDEFIQSDIRNIS